MKTATWADARLRALLLFTTSMAAIGSLAHAERAGTMAVSTAGQGAKFEEVAAGDLHLHSPGLPRQIQILAPARSVIIALALVADRNPKR